MQITNPYPSTVSHSEVRASFMRQVYTWMTGGLLITALVASYLSTNPDIVIELITNKVLFYGIIIAQVGLVIGMSAAMNRITPAVATGIYLLYAALTGVTFSTLFLIYTRDSIANVFLTTACGFAGLSLLGFTTKRDLGPVGAFCGMALFGLIGWGILSLFFPSMMGDTSQIVYSVAGLLIFAGLTAYDTQKLKEMVLPAGTGYDAMAIQHKAAIFGALTLYLDFINLFLNLLRLMGDRRR